MNAVPVRLAAVLGAWIAAITTTALVWPQSPPPRYDVHAVRFAHVSYPVASLVHGAERGRTIDLAFTIWVMRAADRIVLLDAGFYREKFLARWKPVDFVTPAEALKRGLGVDPAQVTDIVISHTHWDHADGADLFPRATIWIQKDEYDYYVGPQGEVLHTGGVDADDAKMFAALKEAGRIRFVDGDAREILPGITVYTGGKHTYASQYVGVQTGSGVIVLASDNAYLYENLEQRLPIAQTLDADANAKAQERMMAMAATPVLVIPGHDPAVFERFTTVAPGVVRISR
jgi:glyoxylase-like metal-dependent hydrolase (beta-lactamase superfamily II)